MKIFYFSSWAGLRWKFFIFRLGLGWAGYSPPVLTCSNLLISSYKIALTVHRSQVLVWSDLVRVKT